MPSAGMPAPDADAGDRSARLWALIAQQIEAAGGWLPFDRYMQLALYEAQLGYYTSNARKLGDASTGGDFVTAPEISPLFAEALAVQLVQLFKQLPPRIVEFGAGSGALASDLIAALGRRNVALQRYSIVEVSRDLMERQQQRLQGTVVEWLTAPPDAYEGVLLANEVLDVMPVRIFARQREATFERGVVVRKTGFAFDDRPADGELAAAVSALEPRPGAWPDGYTSEVGFAARAWMQSSAAWLARGALLVIDYGFPQREYYHPQRLMGTLMCHFRHHAHADPFWFPGLNDLTAHVDFSAMAQAAHDAGLSVLGYTSQAHFLLNCRVLDALQTGHSVKQAGAAHRLLSEAEMGELFKVLAVGRGVDEPLLGFAYGDRRHTL